MSQRASKSAPPPLNLLLSAALETWCHHLLYVRRVYPSNTFCDSYFLGIRYKANRHPGVVEYISDAIKVAVPALIERVADEFCLEVIEEQNEKVEAVRDQTKKPISSLPSAEFDSTPSDSQERAAKRLKSQKYTEDSQSPNKTLDLKPSALFPNQSQSTQQSLSSLSSTHIQGKSMSQDTNNSRNTDHESTPMANLHPEKEEEEKKSTILVYKSFQVLEKFSLYFSPSSEEPTETQNKTHRKNNPIRDMEDLGRKKPQAPLFSRRRRGPSRANKGPSAEELQQQAILAELERGFRNLILNLTSLNRDRVLPSDSVAFKLLLHVNQREMVCTAIEKALDAGSWYPSSAETLALELQRRPHMPLYQVVVDDWDINFHMQRRIANEKGGS